MENKIDLTDSFTKKLLSKVKTAMQIRNGNNFCQYRLAKSGIVEVQREHDWVAEVVFCPAIGCRWRFDTTGEFLPYEQSCQIDFWFEKAQAEGKVTNRFKDNSK